MYNIFNPMNKIGMQINNSINNNMNNIINNNMNNIIDNNMNNIMDNNMNQMLNINIIQNNIPLLLKEFKSCTEDSYLIHAGTKFELENNNLYKWILNMQGPLGTPYEEGIFKIKISFPLDYPRFGPTLEFLNKIYHHNVRWKKEESIGHICYPIFNEWKITGKVKGKHPYPVKEAIYDLFAFFYKPSDCQDDEVMKKFLNYITKIEKNLMRRQKNIQKIMPQRYLIIL